MNEIIGVLMTTHLCNLVQKFKVTNADHRRDAFYSAKLAVTICFQIIAEKKIYWKQLEQTLTEVYSWYKKAKEAKDPSIDPAMVDGYALMLKKFQKKEFKDEEVFLLNDQETVLPVEIQKQLRRIDQIDVFEFKQDIDTECHSYIYKNALTQFQYENEVSTADDDDDIAID